MQISISVQFVFSILLTEPHVAALIKLSQHHYDVRCKLASSETGFLTGWRQRIEIWMASPNPPCPVLRVSSDELDTCLKLLEMASLAARVTLIDGAQAKLCDEMASAFHGALRLANSKYEEWQAVYSPKVPA